ncbi:FAD-binding protein, partial [Streptomyces sp. NPDC056491]|uniref:FAD-binding protein n=1 Tax=Streptomyces sp. NPDC056491 TaxID=3345837 RepID=UPI0036C16443
MGRVLDETYDRMNEPAVQGRYPFPTGPDGQPLRGGLQGPEYMRRMRIRIRRSGVTVLDHSPVTELLTDADGAVAGAAGYRRQLHESYRVRAGAGVLATGGCAFLSGALGTSTDTGDGALFAAAPCGRSGCRWAGPRRRSRPEHVRAAGAPAPAARTCAARRRRLWLIHITEP